MYIDGLAQGCSNSSASALELLQSCAKLSGIVSTMVADDLVMQGARTSAAMLLTYFPLEYSGFSIKRGWIFMYVIDT